MFKFVLVFLFSSVCLASPGREQEAVRAALDAALKQSGMDVKIREFTEKNIEKPVKDTLLPYLGPYAPVLGGMKIIIDQKVELKWEF
jgi:hypothetical protein